MIRKHLTTRVSLITVVAGWAVACGGAGEPTEGSAAATQALVAAPTQISTKTAVVKSVSSIPTVIFTPTPAPQPPITGPIPANASAPIPCSTPDENVKLPDGTMGTLAQDSPWFDGIVSFRLDASVAPGSATERAIVDAIRHYNFMTSVRLVHDVNSTQTDHVLFTTDRGTSCKSIGIGFQGGTHVVNLFSPPTGNTCANFDVAVHEIGHRVGLHHEQRRPDRDKFILIQDGQIHDGVRTNNNIKPGKLSNFEIFQGPGYQVGGFDFDSVMLYPSVTSDPNFAEDVTQPIITRRDGSIYPDPQTGGLSVGDTNTLFVLYPPPPLTSNIGNTCRTAPIKRSKLPINPALFPKPTELMSIASVSEQATFSEYPSTLTAFGAASNWGTSGKFLSHIPYAAGDFNKDGLTDIAEIQSVSGMSRIVVHTAYGSGLNAGRMWADRVGKFEHAKQWLPGDFDKDGRDDMAIVWRDGDRTTLTVLRSNGSAFGTPEHWAIQATAWDWITRWNVGDFNNDGRTDIAAVWNDDGFHSITVFLSTGSGFTQQQWVTRTGSFGYFSKWLAGDFSGDGATDLVELRKDGSATVATVYVSLGSSFAAPAQWLSFLDETITQPLQQFNAALLTNVPTAAFASATVPTPSAAQPAQTQARQIGGVDPVPPVIIDSAVDSSRWAAGDFNDDGRVDLASVTNIGGRNVINVLKSTGSSFTNSTWSASAGTYGTSTQWCAGRFRDPIAGGVATQ